jgi:hypothetical protein
VSDVYGVVVGEKEATWRPSSHGPATFREERDWIAASSSEQGAHDAPCFGILPPYPSSVRDVQLGKMDRNGNGTGLLH